MRLSWETAWPQIKIRANSEVAIIVSVGKCENAGIAFYRPTSGVILPAGVHGVIPPECIVWVRRLPDRASMWSGLTRQCGTLGAPNLGVGGGVDSRYHAPHEGGGGANRTKLANGGMITTHGKSNSRHNVPRRDQSESEYVVETGKERAKRKRRRHSADSLRTVSVCNTVKFQRRNANKPNGESPSEGASSPSAGKSLLGEDGSATDAHSVESRNSFFAQAGREDEREEVDNILSAATRTLVKEENECVSPERETMAGGVSSCQDDATTDALNRATAAVFYAATPTPSETGEGDQEKWKLGEPYCRSGPPCRPVEDRREEANMPSGISYAQGVET